MATFFTVSSTMGILEIGVLILNYRKSLLTGKLYGKPLLADEIIRIKLQCEYVER